MKYGKKIRELSESTKIFSPADWIPYKKLKQLLKNETEFFKVLEEAIKETDQVLAFTIKKENGNQFDIQLFARGNSEAVRKILKKFKKKSGGDIPQTIDELVKDSLFHNYEITFKSVLKKVGEKKLNACAPSFTPRSFLPVSSTSSLNSDAETFVFNANATSFSPSPPTPKQLSIDAPVFTPRSTPDPSIGAVEKPSIEDYEYVQTFDEPPMQEQHPLQDLHPMQQQVPNPTEGKTVCSVSLSPAPPENSNEKMIICNVAERKYSLDWLLEQRLKESNIPAPESADLSDIKFPVHGRKQLYSEDTYEIEEVDFDIGALSHLVSPVFDDEINYDNICDPFKCIYGQNWLRANQHLGLDIHPDLLDKPSILSNNAKQNVLMQFLNGVAPMLTAMPAMSPWGAEMGPYGYSNMMPPMFGPGMDMYSMQNLQSMLASMMSQNPQGSLPFADMPSYEPETPNFAESPKPLSSVRAESPKETKEAAKPKAKSKKSQKKDKAKSGRGTPRGRSSPKQKQLSMKKTWTRQAVVTEEEDLAARTMQSILNKLVPEKFERLLNKAMEDIDITKKETLIAITKRLHKKSISEAEYAPLYTHFVRKLKKRRFKSFAEEDVEINMETILLKLCLNRLKEEAEIDEKDEEYECKKNVFWTETLGNYTLLGELYKRDITDHEQITSVVSTLVAIVENVDTVRDVRSKRVEQLLHLLRSCGEEFEEKCRLRNYLDECLPEELHFLDKQFQKLQLVSKDPTLKPRVRFMIQDLIDLKNKHWEQRCTSGMDPKFLSDIREEQRRENRQKKAYLHSLKKRNNNSNKRSGSKRRAADSSSPRTIRRKGFGTRKSETNVIKRKRVIENPARSPKIDKVAWNQIVRGMFNDNNERSKTPEKKIVPVKNAWSQGPPKLDRSPSPGATESTTDELSTVPSDDLQSNHSNSSSSHEIDEILFETTILEYFDSHDLENALQCIHDCFDKGGKPERLVFSCLNIGVDRRKMDRQLLDKLLVRLFEKEQINNSAFMTGFTMAAEFFDDWYIDVPLLPNILQSIISRCSEVAPSGLINEISNLPLDSCVVWSKVSSQLQISVAREGTVV